MATIERRGQGYRVKIRRQGTRTLSRTFRRLTDAKQWASAIETDMARGVHVPDAAERRRTLADLIDGYTCDHLPHKEHNRSAPAQEAKLAWWREHYGSVTLERLTPALVGQARKELSKRKNRYGKPITGPTMNRYLAALSAACKYGWRELHWLQTNPVLSVTKAAESRGVVRFLSDDERARLFGACREDRDPNILCFVTLALATGLRYSNIRFLQWSDVDLAARTLTVERTKNGEGRRVPLIDPACRALKQHYADDPTGTGWVFKGWRDDAPADVGAWTWRRVRAAAGLEGFRFHDLRHTVASYLTQEGAGLAQVADALGHKTLTMARRYSHQNAEHVRGTLRILGKKVFGD